MIVWGDGTVTTVHPPQADLTEARPTEAPWPETGRGHCLP